MRTHPIHCPTCLLASSIVNDDGVGRLGCVRQPRFVRFLKMSRYQTESTWSLLLSSRTHVRPSSHNRYGHHRMMVAIRKGVGRKGGEGAGVSMSIVPRLTCLDGAPLIITLRARVIVRQNTIGPLTPRPDDTNNFGHSTMILMGMCRRGVRRRQGRKAAPQTFEYSHCRHVHDHIGSLGRRQHSRRTTRRRGSVGSTCILHTPCGQGQSPFARPV